MKVEEIKPRASEGDTIELEGKVFRLKEPNSKEFEGNVVWSQFIVVKDATGEQGCWLKLDEEGDKVSKGSSIKIKGKLGEEYTEKRSGKLKRSVNNCEFEVIGKVQAHAQSSSSAKGNGNGAREEYWAKKFEWDKKVQFIIVRECAIKAVTELAKVDPGKGKFSIKLNTEKDFFEFAEKIVGYVYSEYAKTLKGEIVGTSEDGTPKVETKEERIEKAREVVGETEFKPASTEQKKYIYGYRNNKDEWCKGIIESRYMEKPEIREIGDPKKLSLEDATEWLLWWWGPDKKSGERKKRELEHPRNENGTLVGSLVKGDKTSVAKDILVDEVNALRRENFLIDDVKFKKEMGYNPKTEELTEEELVKLKELLKYYHPKSWNDKGEQDDENFIHPDKLD